MESAEIKRRYINTGTSKKLHIMLSEIFVSEYYKENIMIILKTEDNVQKLIDFLNIGVKDTNKILLKTAEINRNIKLI